MENRLLAFIIAALFSTGAYAAGETGQTGEEQPGAQAEQISPETASFEDLDLNGDGYVSREEASVMGDLAENMEQYDQDQDQQLDRSEFAQFETQILQGEEPQQQEQPGTEEQQREQPVEEQPGQM